MKASKELAAIQRCLRELNTINGSGKVKLIELEQGDGDPVFVNPKDGIAWLEPRGGTKTRIHFTGGSTTIVKGTPAEVAELLED